MSEHDDDAFVEALDAASADARMQRPAQRRATINGVRQSDDGSPLTLLDPRDWQGVPIPQRRWIWTDWIPRGYVTALYGDGGIGKSLLAQQFLTSTALTLPFLGNDIAGGRALGIFCEDNADELHRRQAAINAALDVRMEHLENLRLLSRIGLDNVLMDFSTTDLGALTAFFNQIDAATAAFRPAILVLDTAADFFGGNENVRPQVRRFIGTCLGQLALRHDCAVLLAAHPSVAGLSNGSGTGGSTAWSNTVRSRLYLTADGSEKPDPDVRVLSRRKANYAPSSAEIRLRWSDGAWTEAAPALGADSVQWPVIDLMFDALAKAWSEGNPLSLAPQTRNDGRYFPGVALARFNVSEKACIKLVQSWLAEGYLDSKTFDSSSKKKGLRVLRRLIPDERLL
jgi:hypothetical protein